MLSLFPIILGIIFSIFPWNLNIFSRNLPIKTQVKSASVVNLPSSTTSPQQITITPTLPPINPTTAIKLSNPPVTLTTTQIPLLTAKPTSAPLPQPQGLKEATIFLLNQKRQARGLPALRENSLLNVSAQRKAQDLLAKNYWSHTSPEGIEFWKFFESSGYNYLAAGENLSKGYFDAQSLTSGWMDSEGHRNNILNSSYQEVGIGIVDGIFEGFQTKVVVAHFAQPA